MKKQELIHLHGLLAQVQNHYEEETGDNVEHNEYGRMGVKPTSIHKSKTDHKHAALALAEGITSEMHGGSDGGLDNNLEPQYDVGELLEQMPRNTEYGEDHYSQIFEYILDEGEVSTADLADNMGFSEIIAYRSLKEIDQNIDQMDLKGSSLELTY